MKKSFKYYLVLLLFTLYTINIYAVPAINRPVKVQQPDGTYITIEVHGDEFLNWRTCGSKLIAQAQDGFYYYASFDAMGNSVPSRTRVSGSGSFYRGNGSVTPPASAISRAQELRQMAFSQNTSSGDKVSIGEKKFLTILVEFNDLEFVYPKSNFERLLNEPGYSDNGGTGSVFDFYNDNSTDKFIPSYDVFGPYKASKSYAYYGKNDGDNHNLNVQELYAEIVKLADKDINFADYDLDGDGLVDNVFFYFAGHNEAEGADPNTIWPHKWALYKFNASADGVRVYNYACASELNSPDGNNMCGIGTFCHEFGHVLGLQDYHDTDYSQNGRAAGLGMYSLMSSGNYNNDGRTPPYLDADSRKFLGWIDNIPTLTENGNYSLKDISNNGAYIINTEKENEYYLFENRTKKSWDAYVPAGLLIYHIDKSDNEIRAGVTANSAWEYLNKINAYSHHQCMDLVESCGDEQLLNKKEYYNVPFPGSLNITEFSSGTKPAFVSWAGLPVGYAIKNISAGDEVTFTLEKETSDKVSFSAKVENENGKAIPYAPVTITITNNKSTFSNSDRKLKESNYHNTNRSEVQTINTNSLGNFNVIVPKDANINIKISSFGYNDYNNNFNAGTENSEVKIVMTNVSEPGLVLKKYKTGGTRTIGFDEVPADYSAAVKFRSDELTSYQGMSLKNLNINIKGSSVSKFEVFVYEDNNEVYRKEISKDKIRFGSEFSVDISDSDIIIVDNTSLTIGYSIYDINNGYPIVVDEGPYVDGGGLLYLSDFFADFQSLGSNTNLKMSVGLNEASEEDALFNKGISYINSPKTSYKAGEKFELKLVPGNKKIKRTRWTFNDASKNEGDRVTLIKGSNIISVYITYEGSSTSEKLTYEIIIK